ncbi:hypothetical protein RKD26_001608 [Streptomyces calvus]
MALSAADLPGSDTELAGAPAAFGNGTTHYALAVGDVRRNGNGSATSRLTWPIVRSSAVLRPWARPVTADREGHGPQRDRNPASGPGLVAMGSAHLRAEPRGRGRAAARRRAEHDGGTHGPDSVYRADAGRHCRAAGGRLSGGRRAGRTAGPPRRTVAPGPCHWLPGGCAAWPSRACRSSTRAHLRTSTRRRSTRGPAEAEARPRPRSRGRSPLTSRSGPPGGQIRDRPSAVPVAHACSGTAFPGTTP